MVLLAVPPLQTSRSPLELTVVTLAMPPLETSIQPPLLTVVLTAVPPLETTILPLLLTVVLLAVVPKWRVATVRSRTSPLKVLGAKVTFAPSWFRDYVYIPLGGSRCKGDLKQDSKASGLKNLTISFLLSGLWHGAAWNFIIWGGLHSLFLSIERLTGYTNYLKQKKFLRYAGILLVQLQVLIAWVFFRSGTFREALHVLKCMFSFNSADGMTVTRYAFFYFVLFILMECFLICNGDHFLHRIFKKYYRIISPVLLALVAFCIIFFRGSGHEFIYFQF